MRGHTKIMDKAEVKNATTQSQSHNNFLCFTKELFGNATFNQSIVAIVSHNLNYTD